MKKQLLTIILIIAAISMVLQGVGLASFAEGDKVEPGQPVNIGYDSTQLNYMTLNGTLRGFRYTYFWFLTKENVREQHPVYCLAPDARGAFELVRDDGPTGDGPNTAKYITGEKITQTDYVKVMEAGYPHNTTVSLGVNNSNEGYYATKMALWMVILDITPDSGKVGLNPSHPDQAAAQRVYNAAIAIYNNAQSRLWMGVDPPIVEIVAPTSEASWKLTADGQWYEMSLNIRTNKYMGNDPDQSDEVQLSWDTKTGKIPAGIVVLNGSDDITATLKPLPKNRIQESRARLQPITIRVPAKVIDDYFSENDKETVFPMPTLVALGKDMAGTNFYVATYSGGGGQPYLIEADRKVDVSASLQIAIPKEPVTIIFEMGLRVIKLQSGTQTPLSGAVFEIYNPRGQFIGSYATDPNGEINIPLSEEGTYTVKETVPPQYHILPTHTSQQVQVATGETATITITNEPYGALRIEKRDALDGRPLGGATIQIRHIESGATYRATTDLSGTIEFPNLPIGGYEIRELAAPAGYAAGTDTHTMTVLPLTQGITTYTLANRANPGLRIIKLDRAKSAPIEGVVFEVWLDGKLYGEFVTNHSGEILLANIPAGTYIAHEKSAVEPYVLDKTAQWIEIKAGEGIRTLIFVNDSKGGILLVKLDSNSLAPISNARFRIRQISGGSYLQEHLTNANGEIDVAFLDPGVYEITELSVPEPYLIDDSTRLVEILPGKPDARFVFTNTRRPSLEIIKFDGEHYLPGATFRIARIGDGSRYLDRITDKDGRIAIDGMEPGIYSVRELAAPNGYVLDGAEYHVQLFPGRTGTIVINNVRKPSLKIWKYDMQTAKPLPNTKFSIAYKNGPVIYEGPTNAEGYIQLDNLDAGWVTITELTPPPGYLNSTPPSRDVYLDAGKNVEVRFDNLRCPTLTIEKRDSITGAPIQNVKFNVRFSPAVNFTGGVINMGTFITGPSGRIALGENLQSGWYRVTELEPAAGYAFKEPTMQEVFLAGGEDRTLYFENIPLSALIIRKIDNGTGLPVAGASFRVRYLGGTSGSGGTVIHDGVTPVNGTILLTGLKAGTYVVEEWRAAPGYELSNPPAQTAYISGLDQDVVELVFTNARMGNLVIRKLDSITKQPLKGATFKVTDSSGAVIGPDNGEYVTDAEGLINLAENLPIGSTIVVQELRAPNGYILDTASQTIRIKENTTHSLTFYNTPTGGLQIVKLDEDTRRPIPGTEFAVAEMNGRRIGTYRTDSQGLINLPELTSGWFTITEVKAADSYLLDTAPHNIEVRDGRAAVLEITNKKASSVMIEKTDSVTGKGIYGVTFILYDSGMNPIMQLVTDQDGFAYAGRSLTAGKYHLRELQPADGYERDDQLKTIYIEAGKTTQVKWTNKPVMAQIQIVKYSSDYNSVTGTPAGSLLKGAVFEITRARSGAVVGYITTDARGVAASGPLPLGRYLIKEVTAPPYFQLTGEHMEADLEYPGQIIRLSAYNRSAVLGTEIRKTGNVQVIAGDSMRYDISISNTSNVPLSDFYWSDRLPADSVRAQALTTGTYNQRLYYRILYKTNASEWRVLASNLLSTNNYSYSLTAGALGLMGGEAVTNIRFEFGTVAAGCASATKPTITVQALSTLAKGCQIVNRAEVGGQYQGAQQISTTIWPTKVVKFGTPPPLPKTGS